VGEEAGKETILTHPIGAKTGKATGFAVVVAEFDR
jgi:hypothetical protein